MTPEPSVPRDKREFCAACGSRARPAPMRERSEDGHVFHLAKCRECRFIFVTDPVTENYQRSLARPLSAANDNVERCKFRAGHHYFAAALATYVRRRNRPTRMLDIGCGTGELGVLLARQSIVGLSYQGIEPIADRAALARELGLDVRPVRVEDFFLENGGKKEWDVIVLDNVLEHLFQPSDAIGELAKALSPGGAIAIAVPNVYDVRRFVDRSFPLWIPFTHMNYFSIRTLRAVCGKNGLTAEYLRPSLRGLGLKTRFSWGTKAFAEKWFDLPPRGLYIAATPRART